MTRSTSTASVSISSPLPTPLRSTSSDGWTTFRFAHTTLLPAPGLRFDDVHPLRSTAPVRRSRPDRPPLPPGFGTIWTSVAIDLVGWGIVLPILPLYGERFTRSPVPLLVAAAIAGVNAVVAIKRLPETRPTDTVAHVVEPPPMTGTVRRLILVVFVATSAFTAFEATFALLGQRRFDLTIASTSGV